MNPEASNVLYVLFIIFITTFPLFMICVISSRLYHIRRHLENIDKTINTYITNQPACTVGHDPKKAA